MRHSVTVLLLLTLVAAYTLELHAGGMTVCRTFGFTAAHPSFETAISSLFLHDPDSLLHLGGNLAFLAVFGAIVEGSLGGVALLALFTGAGLAGAAVHYIVDPGSTTPLVGASGPIFGLLAVAGVLRPRLLGFVLVYAGWNVWQAFTGGDGHVSFGAHIGGFFVGMIASGVVKAFCGDVGTPLVGDAS